MDIKEAIELIQDNKHYINNMLIEDNYLEAIDLIIKEGAEQSTKISKLETALIEEDLKHKEEIDNKNFRIKILEESISDLQDIILDYKGQAYYCVECVKKDIQIEELKEKIESL